MTVVKTYRGKVKAADPGTGVFEAIVATYDLDSYGDQIVPGAFADTLSEWAAKGDPIPVIWAHQSTDPESHIGVVEEAEERAEGLWVKGRLDLDQPKAAQVYRLLQGRRVTQFSFAYDVEEGAWIERPGEPPYYELRKLALYEVGPCLIGVNQATELLAVKARDRPTGRAFDAEARVHLLDAAAVAKAAADRGFTDEERARVMASLRAYKALGGGPTTNPTAPPARAAISPRGLEAWAAVKSLEST